MKKIPKEKLLGKQLGKEATPEGLSYYRFNASSGYFHNKDDGKTEKDITKANALNEQIAKDNKLVRYVDDFKKGETKKYEKSFQDMFERVKKKKFNTDLERAKEKAYKVLITPEPKSIPIDHSVINKHFSDMQRFRNMENQSIEDEKKFKEIMKKEPDEDVNKGIGSLLPGEYS